MLKKKLKLSILVMSLLFAVNLNSVKNLGVISCHYEFYATYFGFSNLNGK